MAGTCSELWVTTVLSEEDVTKALVLCYSLRRVFTTRKIAVIVSPIISSNMRLALHHGFDFVFHLEESLNKACLKTQDFSKLFALMALQNFETCAYLSPTIMALKNCDDIFEGKNCGFRMLENPEDTSVFVFRPNVEQFQMLMNWLGCLKTESVTHIGTYLRKWMENQQKSVKTIPAKFSNLMTKETLLLGYEQDMPLVNLENYPNESDLSKLQSSGVLEKMIATQWLKILQDDVVPLIKNSNCSAPGHNNKQLLTSRYRKEPIAIVGMSCRYPGSNNLEEFWNLLFQGQDGTCSPPSFRWKRGQGFRQMKDARTVNAGFLNVPVDEFDGKFFGISPKEALFMDPQHRILHELVWESLEDACIDATSLRGTSTSVLVGAWTNEYSDVLPQFGDGEFYRTYMGNSLGAAAARISFMLGTTGPSIATESGCSSAMVAVHLACRALQLGETNLALACGVNLLLRPFNKDIMPMVHSADGHCKTFSEDANGFARAEGAGVMVLKRLSDAMKDGDHIWGLIRGSAVAQEGVSNSMGTPTVHCESLAMTDALNDANVQPEEVSYVEAHGTGTSVGDPMEIAAISEAYKSPNRKEPLIVGSVKTNVGHTESCSGITGIMKVILAMHHQLIPAHINFTKLNPAIDLSVLPAVIPLESMEWKKVNGKPRIAGVSSFGITGTDAHVIIEEPPQPQNLKLLAVGSDMQRPLHILKISAKSEEAMSVLLKKYKDAVQVSDDNIADICFSANIGRADFPIRSVVIAKTKEDFCEAIKQQKYLIGDDYKENARKICFLFTGQGSQYKGMAQSLYETSPVFRMHFDYCDKILKESYNISITDILWSKDSNFGNEINRTIYSQTSIFCVEYALLKLWESWGIKPDYALGHSLGEFAAAVCSGILSVEDAIKLVAERSLLIDELPQGRMLVIKADQDQVEMKMNQFANKEKILDYAAINSGQQTVIAGDSDVIMEFSKYLAENNIKCIVLEATHAFHSRHMDPILDRYGASVTDIIKNSKRKFLCKYISGMKGDLMDIKEIDSEYWVQHTRNPVKFLKASKKAVELGCQIFIEIGPQPVLLALTLMNNDANLMCLPSLKKNEDEWRTMLTSLGKLYLKGVNVNWNGVDQFYNRKKVRLPSYPFNGKMFWPDVMESTGNIIHPLIGSVIPNASSTKLFQCGLNLRSNDFVKDHFIGQTAVFPGAGYLEMCLAAGLAAVEGSTESMNKPTRPMKLENLSIQAPLAITESKTCQVQTVVEFNRLTDNDQDWSDLSIKIFHLKESEMSAKWLSNATATFSYVPTAEEMMIKFDKKYFQKMLTNKPDDDENAINQVYEKVNSIGLKFGPLFKSIEKIWRNEDDGTLLTKVKVSAVDTANYILHPVILDAMMQSISMLKPTGSSMKKKKFIVPIKVGKFVWIGNGDSSEKRFVHVFEEKITGTLGKGTTKALLLDLSGTVLAIMSDVEFIDTTVKAIEAVLEQQTCKMPDLWEEIWRPQVGPQQHRHNLIECAKKSTFTKNFCIDVCEKYDQLSPFLQNVYSNLEHLVYYYMLKAMYQCGFEPILNSVFLEEDLIEELKILKKHSKLFGYYLRVLEEEHILESAGPQKWKVVKIPPTLEHIEKELDSSVFNNDLVKTFKSTLLLRKVGENLSQILQGIQNPLAILFPEEDAKSVTASFADYYTENGVLLGIHEMTKNVTKIVLEHCKKEINTLEGNRVVLRILEIGAGTGAMTEVLLESLCELGLDYEYTYTDISPAFFVAARKRFEKYSKNMIFKKLNIEEDPICQDFVPAYYDQIVATDVIHATKNLKETLGNVKSLLKPGGRFDMLEMTRANRFITYLFGLLDGFWRFEDFDLRPNHCTIGVEKWTKTLESAGFNLMGTFSCANQDHTCFCTTRKLEVNLEQCPSLTYSNQKSWIIFYKEGDSISNFLLEIIPILSKRKIIVVQDGSVYQKPEKIGIHTTKATIRIGQEQDYFDLMNDIKNLNMDLEGIFYCWSLEKEMNIYQQEKILKSFFFLTKSIFTLKRSSGLLKVIALTQGVAPIIGDGNDTKNYCMSTILGFMKSLQNEHNDLRCRCVDIGDNGRKPSNMLQIFYEMWNNEADVQVAYREMIRYTPKLTALHPSFLSDLELPAGSDRFQLILPETKSILDLKFGSLLPLVLQPGEIEVQVKSSALNFRDILNILKPTEEFKNYNAVGFDFAGVVKRIHPKVTKWNLGDKVYGLNVNGSALPSHLKINEDAVLPIPQDMTFNEACTLPAVAITSYHCLIDIANIKSTDTILIHTASGGVGLSAIQICKNIGATIIATAGSKRKQNYLKSLGVLHIFHSRNTDFGEDILKVTNGRGVDVVLNSLTSDGFKEASLKACAPGARFVEMSKLSIWQPEEVKKLRPDVKYTIVDISGMKPNESNHLLIKLKELVAKDVVTPIPYVRFNGVNIREALQYLQKAKHIGKVVCVLPEIRHGTNGRTETWTPMFHSNATYLITGGLGGIGFEVCKWMLKMGAKYILLAGRNPANSKMNELIIQQNAEYSSKIQVVQLDVSNFDQCKDLIFSKIPEMGYPDFRGVMHAAGTLHDGIIENHTWDTLSSTLGSKVIGTLNLHELTKNNSRIEHFVLFSSIASLFGSPGQSNHSAGNQFEDTFAHFRHSMGLPATSINWGQWGEVGIATEIDFPGIKPFSNLQGINGLEYVLKSQKIQTGVFNVDSFLMLAKIFPNVSKYLDEHIWKTASSSSSSFGHLNLSVDEFWHQYDNAVNTEGKLTILKEKLRSIVRVILNLDESEAMGDTENFQQDLGIDSLMFVEIKNSLHSLLGNRVTVNASTLRDCNTIQLLSQTLIQTIEGNNGTENEKVPSIEEVNQLIKDDCVLSEHIRPHQHQQVVIVRNISKVLLTGVTGTLGPYILRELCRNPQITEVNCLIRSKKNNCVGGLERLKKILKERQLLPEVDMSKVICISGNVAMKNLGMETTVLEDLVNSVDAVFHCAASVRHIDQYRKQDSSETSMRYVNIGGLKNVLEFCCSGAKLKQIFNASSLLAVANVNEEKNLSENWPELDDYNGVTTLAYPITKFVGDVIMKEAIISRGIPGKVFRFPLLSGDSRTGRFILEQNHLMYRYFFFMKTGITPSNPFPVLLLPVDVCAKLSVQIFFSPNASNDIYNIINCTPNQDQDFISAAKRFGYDVKVVEFEEFAQRIQEESNGDSPMAMFKDFYNNEDDIMSLYSSVSSLKQWILDGGNREEFWMSKKVAKIIPEFYGDDGYGRGSTMEHVYRDLLFAKEHGWFKKFGLL